MGDGVVGCVVVEVGVVVGEVVWVFVDEVV